MANSAASGPTTQQIRNVIVVGHTGTGKSTLVEGMLRRATHQGQRDSSHPIVDFTEEEQSRGHSLQVATVSFEFDGCRFNVIDTPGGAEAIGDTLPALAGADTAVFVVDASVGVQPQHDQIWRECERLGMPRIVFLNKLDLERAQYQSNIDALRERYGKPLAPVHMPLGIHEEFDGVIDLLHFNAVEFHDGQRIEEDVPEERVEQARSNRDFLIEAVVENDDEMLERYLEGEVPDTKELAELFAHGVAECGFFPVLCGSVEQDIGIELLMHFLVEECPSPAESHLQIPTDGSTTAICFKTLSDQYLGRINLLRLVSGNFAADDTLVNVRTSDSLRLHQVFRMIGKEQEPVGSLHAGDVFAVAKLDDIRTGDVLTADGSALDVTIPEPPFGHHRVVLHPKTASDDDKLSTALQRLLDEDPSIHTERDEERGLLICSFLGQSHVDVTIDRMQRLFGVGVTAEPAPVAFRETIQGKAAGIGKHVKQSGGHGQYGIAHIEVAPLGRGDGFAFKDEIVGGAIPNSYIPSVEKGVIEAMKKGPLGGFPIVDIEVRLVDGKYHSVDSSDAAFQMAGMLALRDAMANTSAVLLEPILDVDVVVPDDMTGTIMSDLSARRGRIQGSDALSGGRTAVHAQVPEIEALSIITELRALTSGHAEVAMRYHHHEEVPAQISKRLLEQIKSEDD